MSKKTGIVRPLGLALVLAIGFGTLFAIAAWTFFVWESLAANNKLPYDYLVIRADGTPLIRRTTYNDAYQQDVTYRELDGTEVPSGKSDDLQFLTGADLAMPGRAISFPFMLGSRVSRFNDGGKPLTFWYFMDDRARNGHGYFVGYDSESKRRIGFIGGDGFRTEEPPVEQWFPVDGAKLADGTAFSRYTWNSYGYYYANDGEGSEFPGWEVEMISGNRLIKVDLREKSVTTLIESADLISTRLLESVSIPKAAGNEPPQVDRHRHLAARARDRVFVFEAAGKKPKEYMLPEALRDRTVTFYELDGGKALITSDRVLPDQIRREEISWIDSTGKVLRQAETSLKSRGRGIDSDAAWMMSLAVPSPAVQAVCATVFGPVGELEDGPATTYSAALKDTLAIYWPALLVASLLSAALGVYCYRRNCRYAQPYSAIWLIFVFLAGLPGLVAYLFHRRWPVLEKCPACGHEIPRDREECARCGKAFPSPEPKGCEVFA